MKNVYLIRTAAVASLAAGIIGLSALGLQDEEVQLAPARPAPELSTYFPAGYELQPGTDEGEVFEYH